MTETAKPNTEIKRKTFNFTKDLDKNGILFSLNKGNHLEPCGITVTSSTCGVGEPSDFICRDRQRCWTQNLPYSWYCVDLGNSGALCPKYYTMGYASSGNACLPRYWLFQASNQFSPKQYGSTPEDTPENDRDWATLSIHKNDKTLNTEWGVASWSVNTTEFFRYFRIIQTGQNSFDSKGGDDNWSQVLVVNRFELYGVLLPSDTLPQRKKVFRGSPIVYGTGDPHKHPEIIRADPLLLKEIQEILLGFVKPTNERQQVENVKVHEIIL